MAREVTEGVHLLEVGWPEPVGANAYLVDDGDVTLVDAGLPIGRRPLSAELAAAGYGTDDLDRVLVTHYDIDHVGGLRHLGDDVPVFIGSADADLVRGAWSPPLFHHKGLFHRVIRRLFPLSGLDLHPVVDGDRIGGFRAVHTPGHNPGHTVFLHDDLGVAALGDLVWESDGRFVAPPWLDSYDTDLIRHSIARVARESFQCACVGHGRPVARGADAVLRELAAEL
ncbi:MBL fold metallo-hydrolase [Natronomonas marina]|uniref:MBL fold metallo-hydrolase n=1 Tax=Natronomonas marina TaxID=2961939 RepID=UPI0020C96D10|nr:MBL fold metallo-hydrolase [Natronomonas marina]